MSKPLKHGFMTLRNEASCIHGWAKTMQIFCDKITALIDPTSTDKTEAILKSDYPNIDIQYQDRSLGDSDYSTRGEDGSFIMHNNQTAFVQKQIEDEAWFMILAGDERFALEDIPALMYEIEYSKKHGFGCICHNTVYEPIPITAKNIITETKLSCKYTESKNMAEDPVLFHYAPDFHKTCFRQARIQQKTPFWTHNAGPHSGYLGQYTPLITHVPLWHFKRLKFNTLQQTCWSDKIGKYLKENTQLIPLRIPFDNWQDGLEYTTTHVFDPIIAANAEIKRINMKEDEFAYIKLQEEERKKLTTKRQRQIKKELEIDRMAWCVWEYVNRNNKNPEPYISPIPYMNKVKKYEPDRQE
jgi:hypothetical protein